MIVKEYCVSMERQLIVWRSNVEKLLFIAEALPGFAPSSGKHKHRQDLQTLIDDIGKVTDMLKQECLDA